MNTTLDQIRDESEFCSEHLHNTNTNNSCLENKSHNANPTDLDVRPRVFAKQFKRMQDAERFQSQLYSKFDRVMLTGFPRFSQEGQYRLGVQIANRGLKF